MTNNKFLNRVYRRMRQFVSEPYKLILGRILAIGFQLNFFDYPSGGFPPPTPARKYIRDFLMRYRDMIQGRCLEFFPAYYREIVSDATRITRYDVWNVVPVPGATINGDLQHAPRIPDNSFDTIICTHVLCSLPEPWKAVSEIHRMLAPGGIVLCTNPVILQKFAPDPVDCWRFTVDSMDFLFQKFDRKQIHSYGNAATVAGSSYYLMEKHFPQKTLNYHDRECPSVVAIAAWK